MKRVKKVHADQTYAVRDVLLQSVQDQDWIPGNKDMKYVNSDLGELMKISREIGNRPSGAWRSKEYSSIEEEEANKIIEATKDLLQAYGERPKTTGDVMNRLAAVASSQKLRANYTHDAAMKNYLQLISGKTFPTYESARRWLEKQYTGKTHKQHVLKLEAEVNKLRGFSQYDNKVKAYKKKFQNFKNNQIEFHIEKQDRDNKGFLSTLNNLRRANEDYQSELDKVNEEVGRGFVPGFYRMSGYTKRSALNEDEKQRCDDAKHKVDFSRKQLEAHSKVVSKGQKDKIALELKKSRYGKGDYSDDEENDEND